MTQVLSGVRVLEVATWTFVPAAGAVLADWGADVIKVEHPRSGDPQRALVYSRHESDINYMMEQPNRGKRSIGLDIASEQGRKLLHSLVERSDVFLTNYLPSAREKLKIDVDDIRATNPAIVYARGSGQGSMGPDSGARGFDGTSYWSRSGLAHSLTPADATHTLQATPALGDMPSGMQLAGGVAAALFHRERTGEGSVVDLSLLASAMWALSTTIIGTEVHDTQDLRPLPREQSANPLTLTYLTSDRRSIKLSMFESERFWPDLCDHIGRPELVDDDRFATAGARSDNCAALVALLDEIFSERSLTEWSEQLKTLSGAWAVVRTPREVYDDPQVEANGYLKTVDLGAGATVPLVSNPVQFDAVAPMLSRAPEHGEHTEEVLLELGIGWPEIIELKDAGVVL